MRLKKTRNSMKHDIKDIKKLLKTITLSGQKTVIIDGHKVKNKEKYSLFLRKGFRCKCCGNKAAFARLEKDEKCKNGYFHLVLYILKGESEVKLTIDHIIPKALNGGDEEENYQILCEKCNEDKGDKLIVY